jgi:hypothetical protein
MPQEISKQEEEKKTEKQKRIRPKIQTKMIDLLRRGDGGPD